jgi:hypothetical protein
MSALTVVSAENCARGLYRPARHVAFVFAGEAGTFAIDMSGDVFALDATASGIAKRLFAGDGQVPPAHEGFIDRLVETKLLHGPGAEAEAFRVSPVSAIAARLATLLLRRAGGTFALRLALALARIAIRRDGWAGTFAAWSRSIGRRGCPLAPAEIDTLIAGAAAADLSGGDCKERALCAWMLARQSGLDATITIGIALHPLAGHCWCRAGERILGDTPARIAKFAPALTYG